MNNTEKLIKAAEILYKKYPEKAGLLWYTLRAYSSAMIVKSIKPNYLILKSLKLI